MITEYQEHGGAVNTGTSASVQYAWSQMTYMGSNNSDLMSMTYPNGRWLHYVYTSGLDYNIGRISALADDNGYDVATSPYLEQYTYLGLSTIVQHPSANWGESDLPPAKRRYVV